MGWFSRNPREEGSTEKRKSDAVTSTKIEKVRQETNQALKDFNDKFNELNKVLEERGDTAYNVFMSTPASRNYRKKKW